MRGQFNQASRRKSEQPEHFSGNIKFRNGVVAPIQVLPSDFPEVWLELFQRREMNEDGNQLPFAKRATTRIKTLPKYVLLFGDRYNLKPDEHITFDIDFSTCDLISFLAKVAHCAAIAEYGFDAFEAFYLRDIVRAESQTSMNFVGGNSRAMLGPRLPGHSVHRLFPYTIENEAFVALQFFVPVAGDPPPIYEGHVGRLKRLSDR